MMVKSKFRLKLTNLAWQAATGEGDISNRDSQYLALLRHSRDVMPFTPCRANSTACYFLDVSLIIKYPITICFVPIYK